MNSGHCTCSTLGWDRSPLQYSTPLMRQRCDLAQNHSLTIARQLPAMKMGMGRSAAAHPSTGCAAPESLPELVVSTALARDHRRFSPLFCCRACRRHQNCPRDRGRGWPQSWPPGLRHELQGQDTHQGFRELSEVLGQQVCQCPATGCFFTTPSIDRILSEGASQTRMHVHTCAGHQETQISQKSLSLKIAPQLMTRPGRWAVCHFLMPLEPKNENPADSSSSSSNPQDAAQARDAPEREGTKYM